LSKRLGRGRLDGGCPRISLNPKKTLTFIAVQRHLRNAVFHSVECCTPHCRHSVHNSVTAQTRREKKGSGCSPTSPIYNVLGWVPCVQVTSHLKCITCVQVSMYFRRRANSHDLKKIARSTNDSETRTRNSNRKLELETHNSVTRSTRREANKSYYKVASDF